MRAVDRGQHQSEPHAEELRKKVGPDRHRPGPARARLLAEQIPVWAIIGYTRAIVGSPDLSVIPGEVITQVAADYDISHEAVLAALLYYQENPGAIDALLEANAQAIA